MSTSKIARRDSGYRVVCIVPDFCFVPGIAPPVPFPLFTDLGSAKKTAATVHINRKPAFVHDASFTPGTKGDQPGIRKGVVSRTVGAKAWSKLHSFTVSIQGQKIVRAGDFFFMNGKFNGKRLKQPRCLPCKAALALGRPVNPVLGIKFLEGETDYAGQGILPLVWQRSYYSNYQGCGWLGQGWSVPFGHTLVQDGGGFLYTDLQGRSFPLPDPEEGEPVLLESEQIWFAKDEGGHCYISNLDGSLSLRFAPLPATDGTEASASVGDDTDVATYPEWVLVAIEDGLGNHQRIIYHPHARLPQYIIDGNGQAYFLDFADVSGRMAKASPLLRIAALYRLDILPEPGSDIHRLTEHATLLIRYRYSEEGDLVAVERHGSGTPVRQFGYRNHILISHTDAAGLESSYEYDEYTPQGKVLRNHTNLGEEWRFEYREGHTTVTDNLGRTEHYYFDAHQELVRHVKADGSEIRMERDHLGRLLSQTDEIGHTTRYRYSSEGQITAVVRPDGGSEHYEYDDTYHLIAHTDAQGGITRYTYHDNGQPATLSDPEKRTTRYGYSHCGLLESITDPNNSTREYRYDTGNRIQSITDCSGNVTRFAYNPAGQVEHITDAEGNRTAYTYDDRGRVVRTDYPDGGSEHYGYDEAGRLTSHTDGQGSRTEYRYGLDGLPEGRTDALGGTVHYTYDAARRLIRLTNENGEAYRFAYDQRDRLVLETAFDGKTTAYRYNAAGELEERHEYGISADTFPNVPEQKAERISRYEHDVQGNLIRTTVRRSADGQSQSKAYGYDGNGRLIRAAAENHITQTDYTPAGQLLGQYTRFIDQKADRQKGLPPTRWDDPSQDALHLDDTRNLLYLYDANGNQSSLHLPDGSRLNQLYYGTGHLHHIGLTIPHSGASNDIERLTISDIERDRQHREIQRSQGRLTSRYTLDPVGRLLDQAAHGDNGTSPVQRHYRYDKSGQLTQSQDRHNGQTRYRYDPLGRLLEARRAPEDTAETYTYDAAHNLLPENSPAGRIWPGNRIGEYKGIRYHYDTHGNLISSEDSTKHIRRELEYDVFDRLVKATVWKQTPDETWHKEEWHYEYDALDRRTAKWRTEGDGQADRTEYLWDGSRLLQETRGNKTHTYIYSDQGSYEPLAQITADADKGREREILYYHCDQIGVPQALTDAAGNTVWRGRYGAWGGLEWEEKTEGIHQPLRLQNQYCDEETGLHYNFFRYYDPQLGRFISQDPIGLAGGLNVYRFGPNAQAWVDPLGLEGLPALPRGNDNNFGGFFWNRVIDGGVRDDLWDFARGVGDGAVSLLNGVKRLGYQLARHCSGDKQAELERKVVINLVTNKDARAIAMEQAKRKLGDLNTYSAYNIGRLVGRLEAGMGAAALGVPVAGPAALTGDAAHGVNKGGDIVRNILFGE